jgi:hypothetical protein
VPNLSADRAVFLSELSRRVDVRRLMYQTLIYGVIGRNLIRYHSRGIASPLYTELVQGAANALIDRMGADPQFGRDFLAAVMAINQQQALDLAFSKPSHRRIRIVDPAWLFDAIRHHQVHQYSFRAWNMCWTDSPSVPLVETAEMLKF